MKVWKLSREFRKDIYQISQKFPKQEQYTLTSQIRRAAISITANIAEGHGRYHYQEEIHCLRIARGSLNEVLDHLYAALDHKYINQEVFDRLYKNGREIERTLNGYIGYLQKKKD